MTDFHARIVSLLLRSGWIVSRMRLDTENWLFILVDRGDYRASIELTDCALFSLEWQWKFSHEWNSTTDFADVLALPINTPPLGYPHVS